MDDENFVVSMEDIGAVYYGSNNSENLDGNIVIEGVYSMTQPT